jgi:hypothetical protein
MTIIIRLSPVSLSNCGRAAARDAVYAPAAQFAQANFVNFQPRFQPLRTSPATTTRGG